MGKEDQHRLERASVVFGVVGERTVLKRKQTQSWQVQAQRYTRGRAVGDFDSPGQGRAGQGHRVNGESGRRVVAGACSRG
jgi:hypothetical protein